MKWVGPCRRTEQRTCRRCIAVIDLLMIIGSPWQSFRWRTDRRLHKQKIKNSTNGQYQFILLVASRWYLFQIWLLFWSVIWCYSRTLTLESQLYNLVWWISIFNPLDPPSAYRSSSANCSSEAIFEFSRFPILAEWYGATPSNCLLRSPSILFSSWSFSDTVLLH